MRASLQCSRCTATRCPSLRKQTWGRSVSTLVTTAATSWTMPARRASYRACLSIPAGVICHPTGRRRGYSETLHAPKASKAKQDPWGSVDFGAVSDPLYFLDYRPPAVRRPLYGCLGDSRRMQAVSRSASPYTTSRSYARDSPLYSEADHHPVDAYHHEYDSRPSGAGSMRAPSPDYGDYDHSADGHAQMRASSAAALVAYSLPHDHLDATRSYGV
jgi:hypothetical protein